MILELEYFYMNLYILISIYIHKNCKIDQTCLYVKLHFISLFVVCLSVFTSNIKLQQNQNLQEVKQIMPTWV